ncbi:slit-like protein 2 protein-like isoform X2 [Iris pallida]|uniref:Slit-like protein 2 protein-like isoform X2 n=1 Tax=Iris pallida TaxID=29817 RepID=A0AAX6F746_IRIPA|nr:slit-like protein 2 protein-like isoform X2 [Iris pallida]
MYISDGLCDTVKCGEGSCEVSLNHSLGFICKCNQGWSQLHLGDHFKFLPCIIPNCNLSLSHCFIPLRTWRNYSVCMTQERFHHVAVVSMSPIL